jgi:hypothetical protein
VAVVTVVGTLDKGLQLRHVIRMSKVDDIDCNIVQSQPLAQAFTLGEFFFNRVTNEYNNPLALRLVHSVLERKLSDLD